MPSLGGNLAIRLQGTSTPTDILNKNTFQGHIAAGINIHPVQCLNLSPYACYVRILVTENGWYHHITSFTDLHVVEVELHMETTDTVKGVV